MRKYIIIGCGFIVAGCIMAVMAFYELYFAASRSQKNQWRPLLSKSIKLAGAVLLFAVLVTISQLLCRHYHISWVISFMIAALLSLCFLGFCYKFKLNFKNLIKEKYKESKNKELRNNQKKEVTGS